MSALMPARAESHPPVNNRFNSYVRTASRFSFAKYIQFFGRPLSLPFFLWIVLVSYSKHASAGAVLLGPVLFQLIQRIDGSEKRCVHC